MILVAYATKYGATGEIAKRIADRLTASGQEAVAKPVTEAGDLTGYDAFVVGSAVYFGHWLKEATAFVGQNRAVLASRPAWLFSSGPLGEAVTQPGGAEAAAGPAEAEPAEFTELREVIQPRGDRVFSGMLDPSRLGLRDRIIKAMPAGRELLPEGDFRDWAEIDAWATQIARELAPAPESKRTNGQDQ
jgi:menaquinone-dependent protoporphyrinogen oxidase